MQLSWAKMLPASLRASLSGRQNLKKIIANTGWLLADRVLRLGTALIVGVWIARYLGPDQYGLLNYSIAYVALFSAIATLGLDNIVIRDIVRDPTCRDETLGTALGLKFMGGIVAWLLSTLIMLLIRPGDGLTLVLVMLIAAGTIFQAFDTIDFWFQSQLQSKFTVYAKNSAYLVAAALRITLILIQAPLIAFAVVSLLEVVLATVSLTIAYHLNHHNMRAWRYSWRRAGELLRLSWPLALSTIAVILYLRIDQFMLGQLQNERAVGIYAAAVKLAEVGYLVPLALINSVFPAIVASKSLSLEIYHQRLQKLFSFVVLLCYLFSIGVTLFASLIIQIFYGSQYAESQLVLVLLAWNSIFMSLGSARETWMVTEGFTKISLVTTSLGAAINIVLNLFLIPAYGPAGAAVATLISQFIVTSPSLLFFPQTHHIFVMMSKALFLGGLFAKRGTS